MTGERTAGHPRPGCAANRAHFFADLRHRDFAAAHVRIDDLGTDAGTDDPYPDERHLASSRRRLFATGDVNMIEGTGGARPGNGGI